MDLGEGIGFVQRGSVYLMEVRKKGAKVLYNMNLKSLAFFLLILLMVNHWRF